MESEVRSAESKTESREPPHSPKIHQLTWENQCLSVLLTRADLGLVNSPDQAMQMRIYSSAQIEQWKQLLERGGNFRIEARESWRRKGWTDQQTSARGRQLKKQIDPSTDEREWGKTARADSAQARPCPAAGSKARNEQPWLKKHRAPNRWRTKQEPKAQAGSVQTKLKQGTAKSWVMKTQTWGQVDQGPTKNRTGAGAVKENLNPATPSSSLIWFKIKISS
jgi:hypothetical protein